MRMSPLCSQLKLALTEKQPTLMPTLHTAHIPLLLPLRALLALSLLLVSFWLPQAAQAAPDKRVALLIGNAKYTSGMPRLLNPPQDVATLEASLKKLNFTVQRIIDGDQKAMGRAIKQFGTDAQDAQVAFFYYSGHGMQARDENYLIPIAAQIETEAELDGEAINLRGVLRQIEDARPQNAVVILDACRDNPVASKSKSASKGLSRVQNPPMNTLVVFAALPGTTASDNGVFAKELAKHLQQPGVGLRGVFDNVGKAVRVASNNSQAIQRDDQLSEDIVLLASVGVAPVGGAGQVGQPPSNTPAQTMPQAAVQRADPEEEAWLTTKANNTAGAFDAYLAEYPKGRYASAARIARAGMPAPALPPTAPPQPNTQPNTQVSARMGLESLDKEEAARKQQADRQRDEQAWDDIKHSNDMRHAMRYLATFPNGAHRQQALAKTPGTFLVRVGCLLAESLPSQSAVTWSGVCENGLVTGKGRLVIAPPDKPTVVVEGEHDRGVRVGQFEVGFKYSSAAKEGDRIVKLTTWFDPSRGGIGVLARQIHTLESGAQYDGETDANGKKSVGTPHGTGKLTRSDGSSYEGAWVNGKRHGTGTSIDRSGFKYVGAFVDGKENGLGRVFAPNGALEYEGQWSGGQRVGMPCQLPSGSQATVGSISQCRSLKDQESQQQQQRQQQQFMQVAPANPVQQYYAPTVPPRDGPYNYKPGDPNPCQYKGSFPTGYVNGSIICSMGQ